MVSKSIKRNMFSRFNIIVLIIFDILLRQRDICSGPNKALSIVVSLATPTNITNQIFVCYVFFCNFCNSKLLCYTFFSNNSNLLLLLLLLLYYSFCLNDTSLRTFFAKFFKTKVGSMSISSIISLYIEVALSNIDIIIVVKNRVKDVDKYCLRKALKRQKRADIKNFNKDSYSAKKSIAIKSEYFTKKNSTKRPKNFDKKLNIIVPGNVGKNSLIYLE